MKKLDIQSALIGAALTAVIIFSVAASTGDQTAWEYRVFSDRAQEHYLGKAINSSIAEGWEFVSVSGPNDNNWGTAVLRRKKR